MRSLVGPLMPATQLFALISIATYSVLRSAPAAATASFLEGMACLLMRVVIVGP